MCNNFYSCLTETIHLTTLLLAQTLQRRMVGWLTNNVLPSVWNATVQAVSRWLPTAAARVRAQFRSCVICGRQSGTGTGFLQVLRFPLPILIPPTTSHSSSSSSSSSVIRGWYNRPNSGRRAKWTVSPHPKKLKKKVCGRKWFFVHERDRIQRYLLVNVQDALKQCVRAQHMQYQSELCSHHRNYLQISPRSV
jgi:hypothetical protein